MSNTKFYPRFNGLQLRDTRDVLDQFSPRFLWEGRGKVLDVGCGTGEVTTSLLLPLLPQSYELHAVDQSSEMIRHCQEKYGSSQQVKFYVRNIADEDVADSPGQYAKVFSFFCLHWVKNLPQALANISRLLSRNGECLLAFLSSCPLYDAYRALATRPKWRSHMQDVDEFVPFYQDVESSDDHLLGLLRLYNLSPEFCRSLPRKFVFPSIEYAKNAVRVVDPFVSRIPEQQREEYLGECLLELKRLGAQGDNGQMVADYCLMVAYAKKLTED